MAVLKEADRKGGIEVIARNDKGEVLGALQASIVGITDPRIIEAQASNRALMFAHHMGFSRIILEGNALTVINKILHPFPSLSRIGNLFEDAKNMIRNFRQCKVQQRQMQLLIYLLKVL